MIYRKCGVHCKHKRQLVLGCWADHKSRMPCLNGVPDRFLHLWIGLGPQHRKADQSGPAQMLQSVGEVSARDSAAEHLSADYSPQYHHGDHGERKQHADPAVHLFLRLLHVPLESGPLDTGETSNRLRACCSCRSLSQEKRGMLWWLLSNWYRNSALF